MRLALDLALALAILPAVATAVPIVVDQGYPTPPPMAVVDGGYETPAALPTLGGGLLPPTATAPDFDQRIARVRRGLETAAFDAQCAPAGFELRLRRRLRRLVALLASVTRPISSSTQDRLQTAADLLRGYCAAVDEARFLEAACLQRLQSPCPRTIDG